MAEQPAIAYGWSRDHIEYFTAAVMKRLGVTEATTCSNGEATRPTELWSATNIGLIRMNVVDDWQGVEVEVTPWREVRGVMVYARADEGQADPTAKLTINHPPLEIDVAPLSRYGAATRQLQWPFIVAVLKYVGGR